jgi:hypothetical protein
MPTKTKIEDLIEGALQIFHSMKEKFDSKKFNLQVNDLFKTIDKTPLKDLITFWDLQDTIYNMSAWVSKPLKEIVDEEFKKEFMSRLLSTKTFDFYVPIYCLYNFPKGMKLGVSTVLEFQDLPTEVKRHFIIYWKHRFTIGTEYHKTKDEYISLKKSSVFIHFTVKANGHGKATERAKNLAEDSLHIIRFTYGSLKFNLVDLYYLVRGSKNAGGLEGIAGLPFIGGANYSKRDEERYAILTDIFTKTNPNEIEKKIRNAVRIFGIQTSVINVQVRFVLLITCLESLLMTGSDKDYLRWKLAEKSALILGGKRKWMINDFIKKAYDKRSAFVHGSTKKRSLATENDIHNAQDLVINLVWKLVFEFLKNGYTSIQKIEGAKSIDEYIEEIKFGKVPIPELGGE